MGWFENQIEERREADQRLLEESFVEVASVVLGDRSGAAFSDDRIITKSSIDEILKIYHYKPVDIPDHVTGNEEKLDYCLRIYGIMRRVVELKEGWYRDAFGPILAYTKEDKTPIALKPGKFGGYVYKDPETGRLLKLNAKRAELFDTEAVCFYRPMPQTKLTIKDLLLYMKRCINMSDIVWLILVSVAVALVGLVLPRITKALTGPILASGQQVILISVAICVVCFSVSSQLLNSVKGLVSKRIEIKTNVQVQAAMMMRIMALPVSFFGKYSPGELKKRSMSVNQLCSTLLGLVLSTGLTSITSLIYVTQIFGFAPSLVIPSLVVVIVTVVFSILSTLIQIKIQKKQMELSAQESGMSYSMISGIQKIKLAGAEKRLFARWMKIYTNVARLTYNPPLIIKLNSVITLAITLISNIVIYYIAAKSGLDQSTYFAFTAAYSMLSGAFLSLTSIALSAAQIKPILEMAEPFLTAEPETGDNKEIVASISGGLEMNHVSFRYSEDTPYILDDMSLKVRPGEYIAIVGRTGCGKSTLIRLLLGFEKPEQGAIYYDSKDINNIDMASLRRKIGTVMQSDGLFQGDIYSNIVISAPELTLDEAWEAAEKAGIADDIRDMPMGMNTIISEGHGGISGGQKQRIMIARAIAPNPKLLIFDEATSALDNKTQRQISDALDEMGCTRIVIAHRLSTIKNCDRILVMDGGHIIEDGKYDELIAQGGYFADLVERQRLDKRD